MTARTIAVAWTVFILVACLLPADELPNLESLPLSSDKWVHLLLFLGFGVSWMVAAPTRVRAITVGGILLALGTETGQRLLPINRSGDPYDALADLIGLAIGVGIGVWVASRRPEQRQAGRRV